MDSVAATNLPSDFYLSDPLKGSLQKLHHVDDETLKHDAPAAAQK
jgi:hypothetical protein